MVTLADQIVRQLRQHGFQQGYATTAVQLLSHPDRPGLEVRLGTVYLVIEQDGRELYRMRLDQFDLAEVLRMAGVA